MKRSLLLLSLVLILLGAYYIYDRFSYATPGNYTYQVTLPDSNLNIGIIGDSWVAGKKIDTLLRNELLKNNIPSSIFSSGYGGAKSKLIYENLYLDSTKEHSNSIVFHRNLDYCIVIAGVNDAMQRMGPEFYTHHQLMIIKDLLKHDIKPVIVTLPEFGIVEADAELNLFSRKRNDLLGIYSNNRKLSNIKEYRSALLDSLEDTGLLEKIVVVDFDSVITSYIASKSYYVNPPHLNSKGNSKLSKYIAQCLSRDLSKKNYLATNTEH